MTSMTAARSTHSPAPTTLEPRDFPGDARALSELVGSIPGSPRRAVDIERALRLDAALAWSIFRIANSENPLAASIHMPGAQAVNRFLKAAGDHGANGDMIETARSAYRDFEALIAEHCGDRASFDTMVNVLAGGDDRRLTVKHKRAAYRANTHLWGVHAATIIKCLIFHVDEDEQFELAYVRVYANVRRLRPNVPYTLKLDTWQTRDQDGEAVVVRPGTHEPLDTHAADEHGVGLLPEFCSDPLPEIHAREEKETGVLRVEVVGHSVGNSSTSTCAVGEVSRKLAPWPIPGDDGTLGSRLWVETPAEAALCDVLVPVGWTDRSVPEVVVYKHQSGPEGLQVSRELDELAIAEEAHFAGIGPSALRAAEFPQYPQLVEHVCARLGWDPMSFDAYRTRVEYPILNTVIQMTLRTKWVEA